jgi:hypothetical protein
MQPDARMYIEIEYDGDTCDVVIALFRNRGVLPIEVQTLQFSCESHELTEDVWHEATMNLHHALHAIHKNRK